MVRCMTPFRTVAAVLLASALCASAVVPAWAAPPCKGTGKGCASDGQCCSGLVCSGGKCASGCRVDGVVYRPGDGDGQCGVCAPSASTTSFSPVRDWTPCTVNTNQCQLPPYFCVNGACTGGNPRDCSVGDSSCTVNACDPDVGCVSTPLQCPTVTNPTCYVVLCDPDQHLCLHECLQTSCTGGLCNEPGCTTAADCADNNPCTVDTCSGGLCSWPPANCDDGDFCTTDFCNPGHGCEHQLAPPSICDDGVSCTVDQCVNGGCTHTKETCDDGNPCTTDFCDDVATKQCAHRSACDDGDPCTTDLCSVKRNGSIVCLRVFNNCTGL